ncbi:TlpA family protein disulfide reductase [Sphingobacterium bambusae]|uniref:TlpA family protein disulfide reductase n=1 Tax=Sphingobacterium bambusae TaxID=662858 RepID=A0ABW6BBA1_9SPHI|nr:TlpA family protein disulfide reductase [Sphingobacterium bambusae]WPL49148.1 TlpA family protein disulfide reductase [Sphingobacterium bambusae]
MKTKLICICSLLVIFSCELTRGSCIDTASIVAGTSKITGDISTLDNVNRSDISVIVQVPYMISGEHINYETVVDRSGNFSLEFDVEAKKTIVSLYADIDPSKVFTIEVLNGNVTKVNISYDSSLNAKFTEVKPLQNKRDISRTIELLHKMLTYRTEPIPLYNKSPDEYLNYIGRAVSERLEIFVNKDTSLSKEAKEGISDELRLLMYAHHALDYNNEMTRNYYNVTQDRESEPEIHQIDRSYYRFLKDLNLNMPDFQQRFAFPEFQRYILRDEVLDIPLIGDKEITTWIASVKDILADLINLNEGSYYDILAANVYARQLNEELKPLSQRQKDNITKYWKNNEVSKILFRKNEQVTDLNKVKSPVVINETPQVPNNKIMETIVSKYKGKVVFIDFWATWCGPCLEAMRKFRDTKAEFLDKDVVFVYITNSSSPPKLWEEKIKGIGNEHYYLTDDQWIQIMDDFDFESIPSYLIYNKERELTTKFTGFMRNDEVKEVINNLL